MVSAIVAASALGLGLWICGPLESHSAAALPVCSAVLAVALSSWAKAPIRRAWTGPSNKLGQYTLGEKIGQGGMGEVYRARHALIDRDVAIKILPHDHDDDEGRSRFEREAQLTSRLESPNTVAVHDYGRTPDGRAYYVMELVEGYDLETLVTKQGPQPAARVVHLLKQVCGALEEAHAVGLVHRDIKPANIAICERAGVKDVVKVLDFGLVEELGKPSAASQRGALVGTPAYIAPESILTPDAIDGRIDLYALGAVGYWLLTGTPVFDGNSVVELCSHHIHTAPESPTSRLGHPIPADLEAVVMRCLVKDPAGRYANARAVAEALDACDCADDASSIAAERSYREPAARANGRARRESASGAIFAAPAWAA
jgi:serine/threonine-protein kinase